MLKLVWFAALVASAGLSSRAADGVVATSTPAVVVPATRSPANSPSPALPLRLPTAALASLDGTWWLAIDPANQGRAQRWFAAPRPEAKPAKVPWIIQDGFPGYHGVAWYWRDFVPSPNPRQHGRFLLRFWGVDFAAEVWLNNQPVGQHEGGETPFVIDVTDALEVGATNCLAVRVLNPTHQPMDGVTLNQTPHQARVIPYSAGAAYNCGGITDAVELLATPAVRVEDLSAIPDPKTGLVHVESNVRNAATQKVSGNLEISVGPAAGGATLNAIAWTREFAPGDARVQGELKIDQPHLWDLNDPFLYRITARLNTGEAADERSVRCGFRDFRFDRGYFRLNGRRLFLRCTHTCNHFPIGQRLPPDPDLARQDLLDLKVMGFNAIRFIWGGAQRYQLDLCDEIGLMVYEESFASSGLEDSPKMRQWFDQSVGELIRRDRNHPSIIIWGLLNEAGNNPSFRHATGMLPLVRALDPTRLVFLNAGRYDGLTPGVQGPFPGAGHADTAVFGSISNPGAAGWQDLLVDMHNYPRVPHTAAILNGLRTMHGPTPIFLSEYGIGSAVDLRRVTRQFEQWGKAEAEDAQFYRRLLERYLADWRRWRLDQMYARPEDFFAESLRKMAGQRTLGLDALRSNPNVIGYSLTGMNDHVSCGEGLTTTFRELKPGTVDALASGLAPLHWCLFVEPLNAYRGAQVRLEAVLADEDALPPGDYPVRLQVVGPDGLRLFERRVSVQIPLPQQGSEPPLATFVFAQDLPLDGPAGKYRWLATLEKGGAPTGGETEFYLDDPRTMPAVEGEIVLWGQDPLVVRWLREHGIQTRPWTFEPPKRREVILVGAKPPADVTPAFTALAEHIVRGSTAICLAPEVFLKGNDRVGWLPLAPKGSLSEIRGWLYLKDEWAKRHPIFDGLPAGGLMDYLFYRELIPDTVWTGQEPPAEAVAGAFKASQDYSSGLMLSVYRLGAGRFILNTLLIRENLGRHPAAERLLRNLLRYAASRQSQPPADLPPDFALTLKAIGYR